MTSASAYSAALVAAIAGWLTLGALAHVGPGPLSARAGVLPPWWLLAAFVTAAIIIARTTSTSNFVLRTSHLSLLVLPWLPMPVPRAFLVWTGPVAFAVWAGVAALLVVAATRDWRWRSRWPALADPRRAPWLAALGAGAWFGVVAAGAAPMVPGADEPHYLIITQSLLYDRDLKIENNHARRDHAPYFQGTLQPHFMGVRGRDGQIYSIHAPGLPAIVAPAFAIGGYRAVVIWLVAIAAAGIALLWHLAYLGSRDPGAAWFGTLAVACSTPIAFHSFTVYPDLPAAVLTLTGVWALMRIDAERREGPGSEGQGLYARRLTWFLHGAALALLPWMHSRFVFLAGLLGLFVLLRLPRTKEGIRAAAAFLAVPIASAALWLWSFYAIYGTPNPGAPYGTFARTQASWAFVPDGLLGVLFDQQFGLLLYAPVFLVVFGGVAAALLKPGRRLAIELIILAAPYMVAVTHLRMWWGGLSAPVRFSVPVLMAGGIFGAIAWRRMTARGTRAAAVAALLVTAFTTLTLAIAQRGRMAYNVRDGVSLWLEWLAPLADLPRGFPSFFRGSASALILHAGVWLAALALAWLALRRLGRSHLQDRPALAAATGGAFAVAAMTALTIVWRLERAPGVEAAPAQVALLRAAASGKTGGVLLWPRFALAGADAVASSLEIAAPARALADRDRPVFALPGWIPAGRYQLLGARAAPLTLRIVRRDDAILTLHASDTPILLPVDVPSLVIHGPPGGAGRLVLQPATVTPLFDDAPKAGKARRYGSSVVYFLDGNAFVEPEAFWIRGGSSAEIVVQPDARLAQAPVFLRNGPVQNRLSIASGAWRDERPLAPGEERELMLPLDSSRGATRFRLESAAGFRPSEVDRSSTDSRLLGVWVQLRSRH